MVESFVAWSLTLCDVLERKSIKGRILRCLVASLVRRTDVRLRGALLRASTSAFYRLPFVRREFIYFNLFLKFEEVELFGLAFDDGEAEWGFSCESH